uniref:Ribosomal protein S7 n=1 Tax=Apicomplexa sp. corallicolid ex Leiopathes glaberrima TaxID=2720216 RepID=A0A6M3R5K8_9APIC|nr:ribosomal protein S7 [Apicomplexa sp. corallicolid ex Leiopathes glaberrima]
MEKIITLVTKSTILKLFIKKCQKSGKLSKAEKTVSSMIKLLKINSYKEPLILIEQAVLNIAPPIIIKKKRIGSYIYYIPTQINIKKAISIGISWLLGSVKNTKELAAEIINAANFQGITWKKKQLYIKNAISNRVFSHISFLNFSKSAHYSKYLSQKKEYIESSLVGSFNKQHSCLKKIPSIK